MKKIALVGFIFSIFATFGSLAQETIVASPIDAPTTFPGFLPVKKGLFVKIMPNHKSDAATLSEGSKCNMQIILLMKDGKAQDFGVMRDYVLSNQTFGPYAFILPAIYELKLGDSSVIKANIDSIAKGQAHPGFENGEFMTIIYKSFTSEMLSKIDAESKAQAEKKKATEEGELQAYFKANKINAIKSPEGIYYVITKASTGDKAHSGDNITANYTGKFLDGKKFDSNIDSAFHHVQPFSFPLGQGRVIKGWDIAFSILKKGEKATIYVPSSLGYGDRGQGSIPAFSTLVFDVELVDFKGQEDAFSKYFKDNNITDAVKSKEGIYYKIIKQGTGETPKPGQQVTASYTGMLLNGTKFDSNVDPQFNHVEPFSFNIMQGNVIQGWDLGFSYLNKGTKAILYIPSNLAYGENSPSPSIPANSPMIFEVELLDIK
jgi:FKBP-type peptidyl-prolyl cis-trans isomerase